jgi:hypothetical protein
VLEARQDLALPRPGSDLAKTVRAEPRPGWAQLIQNLLLSISLVACEMP